MVNQCRKTTLDHQFKDSTLRCADCPGADPPNFDRKAPKSGVIQSKFVWAVGGGLLAAAARERRGRS